MDLADLAEAGFANTFAAVLAACTEVDFDALLCARALPAKDFAGDFDVPLFNTAEVFLAVFELVFPERMIHLWITKNHQSLRPRR